MPHVWVVEFQHEGEGCWYFVYAKRRHALDRGKVLERDYNLKRTMGRDIDPGQYRIYKTVEFYYGA